MLKFTELKMECCDQHHYLEMVNHTRDPIFCTMFTFLFQGGLIGIFQPRATAHRFVLDCQVWLVKWHVGLLSETDMMVQCMMY